MKRTIGILLLILTTAAAAAVAQTDQTGVLQGRVTDTRGEPISGAVVLVTRIDGGYPKDAVTGGDGVFRLGFLPPGAYDVQVQAPGFMDQRAEAVRVSASGVTRIEIEMPPGEGFTEEVTVTAAVPLVETATTEQDLVLDQSQIELLPTDRSATDLVKLTPGATNQSVWGGSTDQANSYQLDGVSVNQPGFGGDFLLPNVDWIEELQVKGLGAGAEYGNFQGGVINIVTKSGGNALRGGVRLNYEDADLKDSNVNTEEAGFETDGRIEANADLSGPLVRDRL